VTGSRTWIDVARLYRALTLLHDEGRVEVPVFPHQEYDDFPVEPWVLVSGHATDGVDAEAEEWAEANGVQVEPHPADWAHGGQSAGFTRNREMVDLGAVVCMAFAVACVKRGCTRQPRPHGTHGTLHCSAYAHQQGMPVAMHRDGW